MADTSEEPWEIEELLTHSLDDLFGDLGNALEGVALDCLNRALASNGGSAIKHDGISYDMTEYIVAERLPKVLAEARRLAESHKITGAKTSDPSRVRTDDDAISFIMGYPRA